MLPPVKFNMLGQMQLRGSGRGTSSTNTVNSCNSSPESKPPNSSKTLTPASSASSSSSSASSLSPGAGDSSTLLVRGSKGSNSSSSSSNGSSVNVHGNITLAFAPDAHQINSAFAWQLANSSQSIDHQETRSNNQSECRGAGDGVAVGGLQLNSDVHANLHHLPYQHLFQRKSPASFSASISHLQQHQHFQHQQHEIGISTASRDQHHHQHQKSGHSNNQDIIVDDASSTNGEDSNDPDTVVPAKSGSGGRTDSPLDFSTKKKFKPEPLPIKGPRHRSSSSTSDFAVVDPLTRETSESPCSRLRNILSMKSPSIPDDMAGTVLNLSKESPLSTGWCKSESQSNSNSSSPVHEHSTTAFVQSNSPRPATIPMSMATTTILPPVSAGVLNGSSNGHSGIGLPSWGSGVYSPSISPILNQTVPANGTALPLSFDTSPTLFPHHIAAGAASPAFSPSLSLHMSTNGSSSSGSKARVTRPFKAYPKDPLSFSSVGLYGLPLGTTPGTTEAVIHQQSNQAYAEFRKQMLSSSQFGKSKRAGSGHRNNTPYSLPPDSLDDLCSDGGSMMRANDSGSASDDGNSLSGTGKNKLGKSEQQMKDEAYWERRRKNNEAAKRSRDARRAKEDEIAIRAAFLEQENLKLRFEVCALKSETAKLRCMLYSS